MALPVLQTTSHGFPAQFNSEISNLYANENGDNCNVTVTAGNSLIAIAIGLKSYDPFDLIHGASSAPGFIQGLNDFMPSAPLISDTASVHNSWTLATNLNLAGADPSVPSYTTSSKWSLDGFYPSIYVWYATNVTPGTYNVNLNSMYTSAGAPQWQLGRPIFDGGVNFQVIDFGGLLAAAAGDGARSSISSANPAVATAFTTTQGSELLLSVGLMKSGNVFGLGSVIQGGVATADVVSRVSNGKLVGSEAHYMVEYAIPAAASATTQLGFANPLGYEMLVSTIALKHA